MYRVKTLTQASCSYKRRHANASGGCGDWSEREEGHSDWGWLAHRFFAELDDLVVECAVVVAAAAAPTPTFCSTALSLASRSLSLS